MATFNPQVQQNPDYPLQSDQSHAISSIAPNTSKEIGLKGIASGLAGGVEIAEGYVEQSIKDQTHAGLDTINQSAIDRLNEAKANPNLLEANDTPVPPEALKGLPKTLDALDQARANNKISQTYIDMQKDALAKSLRAQYPGHRDFVDEVFAKSSREDPANRYITSLVGDINSLMSSVNSKKNETRALLFKGLNEFPSNSGWDSVVNAALSGQRPDLTPDKIRSLYFRNAAKISDYKADEHEWAMHEHSQKESEEHAGKIIQEQAAKGAVDALSMHLDGWGLADAADLQRREQQGLIPKLSDEEHQKQLTNLIALKNKWVEDQVLNASRAGGDLKNPLPSPATVWGIEKTRKAIEDQAKLVFDPYIEGFTNEHYGLAASSAKRAKAVIDDQKLWFLDNKNAVIQRYNRSIAALTDLKIDPAKINSLIVEPVGPDSPTTALSTYIKGERASGLVDGPGINRMQGPGRKTFNRVSSAPDTVPTATEMVTNIQRSGLVEIKKDQKVYKDILDQGYEDITDHKIPPEMRVNNVNKYFGVGNEDLLNQYDHAGKVYAWKTLTNDKMSGEIHKLGGQPFDKYQTWVKHSFGTSIYREEIATINKYANDSQMVFGWDNVNHQFKVNHIPITTQFGPGKGSEIPDMEFSAVQDAVFNLNQGLKSVSTVSKYTGEDPNSFMYKLMKDSGYTGPLLKAIENAHRKQDDRN